MELIFLQQQDIFSQFFSGLQFTTFALVAIGVYAFYKLGKAYGWF